MLFFLKLALSFSSLVTRRVSRGFFLCFLFSNYISQNFLILFALFFQSNIWIKYYYFYYGCYYAIVGAVQALMQTKIKRFIAYTVIFNNAFFLSLVLLSGFVPLFNLMNSLICYILVSLLTILPILLIKNATTDLRFYSLSDWLVYAKQIFFLFSNNCRLF